MTRDLPELVARIWSRAGYHTTLERQDGHTYVIASERGAPPADLVLVVEDDRVDEETVESFRDVLSDLAVDTPYVVTDGSISATARRLAQESGVVPIDGRNLSSLADESGVAVDADDEDERPAGADASSGAGSGSGADAPGSETPAPGDEEDAENARERLANRMTTDEGDEGRDGGATDATDTADASDDETDETDETDEDDGERAAGGDESEDADEAAARQERERRREQKRRRQRRRQQMQAAADGDDDSRLSRRAVVKGALAGTSGAAALALVDMHVTKFVLGGASMPAYNETNVTSNAVPISAKSLRQGYQNLVGSPVQLEGVVSQVREEAGLVYFDLLASDGETTLLCRHDGEAPTVGAQATVWGVVQTTTSDGGETVLVDVVKLETAGGAGGGTRTGGSATTTTGSG